MSSKNEPTAAEQAAWHAGLDEGREQGQTNTLVEHAALLASYVFEQGAECGTFTLNELSIGGENTGDWKITVARVPTGDAPGA